jgi:hypothetical protein
MYCLCRPISRRKDGSRTFEIRAISSTFTVSAGTPFKVETMSETKRARVRSPHESGCTASCKACSGSSAKNTPKPTRGDLRKDLQEAPEGDHIVQESWRLPPLRSEVSSIDRVRHFRLPDLACGTSSLMTGGGQ